MKKMAAMLIALCICCMMMPAMAEGTDSLAGVWTLYRAVSNGVSMRTDGTGISMALTLNEDGSFTLEQSVYEQTETMEGTWEASEGGVILVGTTGTEEISLVDGEFMIEAGGSTMFLSRTPPEDENALAPVVAAETLDQFNGTWKTYEVRMMGMTVSAADLGTENVAVLVIEDGKITETSYDDNQQPRESVMEGKLTEEGTLSAAVEAEGVSVPMLFELREDGKLTCTLGTESEGVSVSYMTVYVLNEDAAEEPAA